MCTTEGPSSSTTEEPSPSTTEEPSSSTTEEPSSSTTEEPAVSLSTMSSMSTSTIGSMTTSSSILKSSAVGSKNPTSTKQLPTQTSVDHSQMTNILTTIVPSTTLVSTSSSSTTPTNDQTINNIPAVYISAAIGLIILILILTVGIGLCFIRLHYHSKVQHKALQSVAHELKDITNEQDDPVTGDPHSDDIHHSTFTNPDEVINATYSCIEKTAIATVTDGTYSVIHSDNMSAQMQESGHYDNVNKESSQNDAKCDEITSMYATISTPVTTTNTISIESSQYAPPQVGDQTYAFPHSLDLAETVKEEESVHSECLYSDVRSRKVPIVPTKSSDLKQYLDTCPVLNVGIYSESINPLDFTCNKEEDEESDPHFLAPIYPAPTMIPESAFQPVAVTSDSIKFKNELGTGQFGEVMLADTNGLSLKDLQLSKTDENRDISLLVAVKKLRPQTQHDAFDVEVKFMSQLKHPNVVCLLGVCSNDPAFIMMEYMEEGDLSQFLQRYSEIVSTPSSDTQIATSSLVYMAFQIASAMKYLSALGFVHRDLASRNYLIGKNNVIKVADLGVNMKLYQSNYYRIRGNKLLPIRWMATECFSGKFSEKSDVWAFGVIRCHHVGAVHSCQLQTIPTPLKR